MRKILNVKPEYLPEYGDCLSAVIYKIFQFNKIPHYELLFANEGHISYTPCPTPEIAFDTNSLLKLNASNYFEVLENQFNIRPLELTDRTISSITNKINCNIPIILNGRAVDMPWRNCSNITELHSCLVIGYDDTKQCLLCLDPIFEKNILELSYDNVQTCDEKTYFVYFDFSHMFSDIKYNLNILNQYFRSINNQEYSWDCFIKLCLDILKKNSSGNLFVDNYYNYLLNNKSWFFLTARCGKMARFFSYLYTQTDDILFIQMKDLADQCRSTLGIASSLVIKYSQLGDNKIAMRVIGKVLECAEIEREIHTIINEFSQKL